MSREHLKIDPEFRDKIPPLTEAEFEQLRENILADGEVYEPIVVWDGTIIDGHNRWRIICENWELLKDKYRVKQMDFADKWAAAEWMYKKQLGRRNLTEQQRELLIGKMYQARKKSVGEHKGNQYTETELVQNEPIPKPKSTAEAIARELGIGVTTVKRSEQFAKGVDAIKEAAPAAADKILKGEVIVTKELIRSVPKMEPEAVKQLAEDIAKGEPVKQKKPQEKKPEPISDKKLEITLKEIIADMYDQTKYPEFTLECLLEDITANGMEYVSVLRNTLIDRSTLLTPENKPSVVDAINGIITEIQKLKELIET